MARQSYTGVKTSRNGGIGLCGGRGEGENVALERRASGTFFRT